MVQVMALCRGDREEIRIKMVHPSLGDKHLYLESVDTHNVVVDSLTREDLRGEGNGVASVTLFTFTLKLGAHADTACVKLGPHADIADTACVKLGSHAHTACVKPLPPC